MKKIKKLYIGIGISLLFLILLNIGNNLSITEVEASGNQITLTEVFPDRTDVYVFDTIFFTIHVTADGNPVPDGLVTIHEETDSFYEVSGNISNGVVILEWVAQPWTPTGWCTFIANYEGTTGYDPSSDTTQVCVSDPVVPGVEQTQTTITPDLTTVYPNDTVNFEVTITIMGGAFPFFSGGYITLFDVTENVVLSRHDIVTMAGTVYITDMSLIIPPWYSYGWHTIEARYSGSYNADHASSTGNCTIQTLINGYTILMTGNTSSINREQNSIQIDAYISGDDPTGKILTLNAYQDNGSVQMLLDEITATSRDYTYIFTPQHYHQLGPITFELLLKDSVSEEIEASDEIYATIFDTIDFIYEFNSEIYTGGDIVELTVYSVETDVPTQPVLGSISVTAPSLGVDLTEPTDVSGRADFSWQIPIDTAGSTHGVEININPDETVYPVTSTTTSIDVRGDIQFIVEYPTNIQRGEQTVLNCTILGPNSTLVTEGTLNLKYQSGTLIWSTEVTGITQYTYDVSLSHIIGPVNLVWDYEGSAVFEAGTLNFTMNVFLQPHFTALMLNRTSVTEGKTVEITGQLIDEVGQGVPTVNIDLYDNDNPIATVTTLSDGTFIYEYIIPNGATLGVHVIESRFTGDYNNYKLAASNFGSATLTVKAPIQLNVDTTLIGEETTNIQISGGTNEGIDIAWCDLDNPTTWYSIGSIILDQTGQGIFVWTVPSFKGEISIRAENQYDDMAFAQSTIYMRAQVTVDSLPSEIQVQEWFTIEIHSNEEFQVYLDEIVEHSWTNDATLELTLALTNRGLHTLKIETRGDYVVSEEFTYNIIAVEPLTGTLDLPISIASTSMVKANVTIQGLHEGPIAGITVHLLVDGITRATATTATDGKVTLSCSLLPGTYNITCITEGAANHYLDIQLSQALIVQSGTQLEIPPIMNAYYYDTYTLNAILKDDQNNPIMDEEIEFLLSGDQGNTWSSLGFETTNINGIAEYEWFIDLSPDNYMIKAQYLGSNYYDPSLTSRDIIIERNGINVVWNPLNGYYGTNIQLNASVSTDSGYDLDSPVDVTINIYYEDQWTTLGNIQSDSDGFILLLINLSFNPGTYPIQIDFAGNENYYAENWEKTLTVNPLETIISLNQEIFEVNYGTIQNIPVYVTSSSGDPIVDGQMFCYILNGNETLLGLNTNISQGYCSFDIPIEDLVVGNYKLHLEWAGNTTQAAAVLEADINVSKGNAELEPTISSGVIEYGSTTYWYAYVTNDLGNPIANIPISFATTLTGIYWDQWGTVMTDETGYATIEIVWIEDNQVHYGRPGTYTIRIAIEDNNKVIDKDITRVLSVTQRNVILILEDVTVSRLGTTTIEGTLTTSTGDPIPNAIISLHWNANTANEWEKIITVNTNTSGYFFTEITTSVFPGYYELRADYAGDTYNIGSSENAILEVLDNPSKIENLDITPLALNLGDDISISVNATDFDTINSVTAIIRSNETQISVNLEYLNNSYQKVIWCDTQYQIGTWIIDIVIVDGLGIETIFTDVSQFEIIENPAPEVNYSLNAYTIIDGETIEFTITASDTLGIASVKIEIDHAIYDITQNNSSLVQNGDFPPDFDGLHDTSPLEDFTYSTRAPEQHVFYFNYTPKTTGNIPFVIYVEDNAGQIRTLTGSIMVEAVAPELFVGSMSSLNGTAPFPFSLILSATDGSGINFIHLYANSQEYILQYNSTDNEWKIDTLFTTGSYILTAIAEDNAGVQTTINLGTLIVSDPGFALSSTENGLGETLTMDIDGLNPEISSKIKIIIYSSDYSHEIVVDNISTTVSIDIFLNENFPLAAYSINLEIELKDGTIVEFQDIASFTVFTNSVPVLDVIFENQALSDGEATNFTIQAFDSLGIDNIVIVRTNETIILTVDANGIVTGEIGFDQPGTYLIQVIATDKAGAQSTTSHLITVNAKGPEFENVYPSTTMLAGINTPFLLEVEAVVTDASGVDSVVLYLNSTPYTLSNDFGVWHTSVQLSEETYVLKLVATDIYGTETTYILGEVTPEETTPITTDPPTTSSSDPENIPENNTEIDPMIGLAALTVITILGSVILNWRKRS